jgi:hypothetical protein
VRDALLLAAVCFPKALTLQDAENGEQRLQEVPALQQGELAIVQDMPAIPSNRPTNKRTHVAQVQSPERGDAERAAAPDLFSALSPANYVRLLAQSYQQASILISPSLALATSQYCQTCPLDRRSIVVLANTN